MSIKPEIIIEIPYLTSAHLSKFMGVTPARVNDLVEQLVSNCEILLPPTVNAFVSLGASRGTICYIFSGHAGYAAGLALSEYAKTPSRKVTAVKHVSRLVESQVGAADYADALEAYRRELGVFRCAGQPLAGLIEFEDLADALCNSPEDMCSWLRRVGIQRRWVRGDAITEKGSVYGYQQAPDHPIYYRQEVVELYRTKKLWAPRLIGPPPTSFKASVSRGVQ